MSEPPKRRWLRFSLRTLLVAVTLVAVLLGAIGLRLGRARHDQRVLAGLPSISTISYDMSMSSPEWTKTRWVMERLFRVDGVELGPLPRMADTTVDELVRLDRLEKLKVESDRLTDESLRRLQKLSRLRVLGIASPHLTDEGLSILGQMKQLRVLAVESPQITPGGIERLKRELPNCQVRGFETIDVIFD